MLDIITHMILLIFQEAKEEAQEVFTKLANAYEILKDEESRNDYNYMLDNPGTVAMSISV